MTSTCTRSPINAAIAVGALFGLLVAACSGVSAQTATSPASQAPTAALVTPAAVAATATSALSSASPTPTSSADATPVAPVTTSPATTSQPATASTAPTPAATSTPVPVVTPAPTPQPQAGPVAVTLSDIAIKLDRSSAPAGSVTFAIKNAGTVIHELVVLKTDIAQNQIPADPSKPGLVTQPGFIGQTPIINAGGTASLTLTLGPGKYVLLCNEPAHYLIGMHTGFTIN